MPRFDPRTRATSIPEWRQYRNALSTPPDPKGLTRRSFLQAALVTGTLTAAGIHWLSSARAAHALGPDDRILVAVLLGGGNDGWSMVSPADDGRYQDARGPLAQSPELAIPIESGLYWHQNLGQVADLYDRGQVAIVQGIGDPADNRSHFSSMARWMRGAQDFAPVGHSGWLGRWLDGMNLDSLGGLSIGNGGVPLHVQGNSVKATTLSPVGNIYGANVEPWERPTLDAMIAMAQTDTGYRWADVVADSMAEAIANAAVVEPIFNEPLPQQWGLQRDLALAAEAINLDIGARIICVELGGFDTHANHRDEHDPLMAEFDLAIGEFFGRLDPTLADRVSLVTFSEFGRSWGANGSNGIDHGTASTVLAMGANVRGGLYGELPDLSSFDSNGDLHSTVDFRSYYATILDSWLQADSNQILGGHYEDLGLFTNGPAAWGDVNCDGELNANDAAALLEYQLGLRSPGTSCPLGDPANQIHLAQSDFNRDGDVNLVDALLSAQCAAGNDNGTC